ncbi:MAG: hypothetical protein SNJ77_03360, partial [Cytophagales bacterium]
MQKKCFKIGELGLIILMLLSISCMRRNEKPRWNVDVIAPLVSAKLSLENLIADSLKNVDSENKISVVYAERVADFSTDTLLPLNGQSYIKSILLKDFELNSNSVTYQVGLGEVLRNTTFTDPSINLLVRLLLLTGSFQATIPSPGFSGLFAGPIEINADRIFRSADVISGTLEILVTNENAFALENLDYELRNKNDGALVGNGLINRLNPGQTDTVKIDLAGKRVEGFMNFYLNNMDIPPTQGEVLFDVNKGLKIVVTARNLKVNFAEAVFPKQDVLNDTITTKLDNAGEFRLKSASAKSGFVSVKVESTAPDTIFFTYKLWDARINGDTFKVVRQRVLPALQGQSSSQIFIYPLNNFFINLSGPTGDSVNFFRSQIIASFDSTGRLVRIDGNDSLRIEIRVFDVLPETARGYFGQQEFKIGPTETKFSIFDKVKSGSVEFKDADLQLRVSNGAGLPAKMVVNNIQLVNNTQNKTETLQLANNFLDITPAIENPFTPSQQVFSVNNQNSNLNQILGIFPDKFIYEATITANPLGNNGLYDNFLKSESRVQAFVDVKVPLSMIANELKFSSEVNYKGDSTRLPNDLNNSVITLRIKNGYPLSFN